MGMAKQEKIKTSRRFRGECMVAKMSVNASLSSLHDKSYPCLGLSPSDLGKKTVLCSGNIALRYIEKDSTVIKHEAGHSIQK